MLVGIFLSELYPPTDFTQPELRIRLTVIVSTIRHHHSPRLPQATKWFAPAIDEVICMSIQTTLQEMTRMWSSGHILVIIIIIVIVIF